MFDCAPENGSVITPRFFKLERDNDDLKLERGKHTMKLFAPSVTHTKL